MLFLLSALAITPTATAQDDSASGAAPATAPVEEEEVLPLTKMPELVDLVQAPYPEEAKTAQIEGSVLLLIEIGVDGKVSYVEVLEEPGYGLGEAAVQAIQASTFSPAEDANGPTVVALEFNYGFVLDAASIDDAVPEEPVEPVELPVTFEGQVLELATRTELDQMTVIVVGTEFSATTDTEGCFEIRGLPPGNYQVAVVRPGWAEKTLELEIQEGLVSSAEIWVRNESYGQDAAVGVYRKNKDEITTRTISMSEAKKIPGTFGDPIRVIQNLPGAGRAPFSSGLLIIRGANPEDSGVYIDGIRIPYVYHLGGFVSVINPEMIQSVDYLPGSYGVQYGRSTGGAVDVTTKKESPEQDRIVWSTDLLDSGGLYEGRLGKDDQHHVAVAARRSYVDVVLRPFQKNRPFSANPVWYDYQLRYSYHGFEKTQVSFFLFGFDDKLLVTTDDGVAQSSDQDAQGDLSTHQFTHRLQGKIEHEISDTLSVRVMPSFGVDYQYLGLGQSFQLDQTLWLSEIRAELPWKPNDHVEVIPGLDLIGGWWNFQTELPFNPDSFVEYDPLAEREAFKIEDEGTGWGPDLYLKANLRPFKDLDRLYVQPGIRFSVYSISDQFTATAWDPRLSFKGRVAKNTYIKGATGLYTQPPQFFESYAPGTNDYNPEFEKAWASSLGLEQQIKPGLNLETEGFYKELSDLIVNNRDFQEIGDIPYTNEGAGEIYGFEVMLRQDPINNVFGWVSYTWSQSWRQDYEDSDRYLYDFDQTHIMTALAGVKLPYQFEVSGRVQYVTGTPYTPYSGAFYDADLDSWTPYSTGKRNTDRLGAYTAVDLRAERAFTFKHWRMLAYVDFLNVYRGDNPEFRLYNYDYTDYVDVRGLPFLPSPGVELEFYL